MKKKTKKKTKGMVYQWADGARIKINAQKAGEEIERVRLNKRGYIEPQDVLDFAGDPKTELHKHFEWDDTTAALQYRLVQAGDLVRSVKVIIEEGSKDQKPIVVRALSSVAFEGVGNKRQYRYVSTFEAMKNVDMREQILTEILDSIEEMYSKLKILKGLVQKKKKIG